MPWLIMRTEPAKEQKAAAGMNGFETHIATMLLKYRNGHAMDRRHALKEVPLIPRIIFIYHPDPRGLQDIAGHKYTLGLIKDPTMNPEDPTRPAYAIPDYQMGAFQCAVNEMNYETRRAFDRREPPPEKPEIVKSFEEMVAVLKKRSVKDGLAKEAA